MNKGPHISDTLSTHTTHILRNHAIPLKYNMTGTPSTTQQHYTHTHAHECPSAHTHTITRMFCDGLPLTYHLVFSFCHRAIPRGSNDIGTSAKHETLNSQHNMHTTHTHNSRARVSPKLCQLNNNHTTNNRVCAVPRRRTSRAKGPRSLATRLRCVSSWGFLLVRKGTTVLTVLLLSWLLSSSRIANFTTVDCRLCQFGCG